MMIYDEYDEKMHELFEQAFIIRDKPDSTIEELLTADNYLHNALTVCTEMEKDGGEYNDDDMKHKIIYNRIRCFIERLAVYSRLIKLTYNTPQFNEMSVKLEKLCGYYKDTYAYVQNDEIQQSQYQLNVFIYQSMAANYFRRSGMGANKELCQQAVEYIEKAIELTHGDDNYKVLHNNKYQILLAMNTIQ
ncbi:MAG: hypothetical protein LBL90_00105 [Prevotellaceae bacterium]|jgi:uncharacterized protein YecE (DUF72 family)|nr:hypothetical protein [Prevotellaceae bacterium]